MGKDPKDMTLGELTDTIMKSSIIYVLDVTEIRNSRKPYEPVDGGALERARAAHVERYSPLLKELD